jgi:hypothetical protein
MPIYSFTVLYVKELSGENMEKNTVEEVASEVVETAEDVVNEVSENADKKTITTHPKANGDKLSKFHQAKSRIEEAAEKIKSTDEEIEECLGKIDHDLNVFKEAEVDFVENTLKSSQMFLKTAGVSDSVLESAPHPIVDMNDPNVKQVHIKSISSGGFKGFMLGLLGGAAVLGAWCYSATQALGLPLLPDKFPDMDRLTKALEWTSQKVGQGSNVSVGAAVVVVAILASIFLLYWLTKAFTTSSNLRTATRIEEDTEFYCTKKSECKDQMGKVREHIAQGKQVIKKYDVLLGEQNAKLKRAFFVEEAEKYDQLHNKTKEEINKIKKLTSEVEKFLKTPMAERGILNKESIEILGRTNKAANSYIMEIYR